MIIGIPYLAAVLGGTGWLAGAIFFLLWIRALRQSERAHNIERMAIERRDRFLSVVAVELEAPLAALRTRVAKLQREAIGIREIEEISSEINDLKQLVHELGHLPSDPPVDGEIIDCSELVREIVASPPFSDRGPTVLLRIGSASVRAERERLGLALRLLLWLVRREVGPESSLRVELSQAEGRVFLELDISSPIGLAGAVDGLPGVMYGLTPPKGPLGGSLVLRLASEIARTHGGRLSASSQFGHGERLVLELAAS